MEEHLPPKPLNPKRKDPLDNFFLELELSPEADTIHMAEHEIPDWPPQKFIDPQEDPAHLHGQLPPARNQDLVKSLEEKEEQQTTIDQLAVIIEGIKKKRISATNASEISHLPGREDLPDQKVTESAFSSDIPQDLKDDRELIKLAQSIYLSCGQNQSIKADVVSLIKKLGLTMIPKQEGVSIMKQFEEVPDLRFAVVVLSGDDFVYSKDQMVPEIKLRPAQHVVLELGFLLGKLGRQGVFVLYQELKNFEFPTNFFDILYTPYTKMGSWQFELLRQMKSVGFDFDANKLL